jgi:flagellar basal body-associated protein FliL
VIIKLLFVILVLSSVALVAVAIAVFVRVWWHFKSRRAQARNSVEAVRESGQQSLP